MTAQKEECYFLLAERSLNPKHCTLSNAFQEDCRLHLLTKKLSKRKDYETLLLELQLPLESIKSWTVIYRNELNNHYPLDITWCTLQTHPSFCKKAAQGLYWDRLNRYFRCQSQSTKLQTRSSPSLQKAYEERKQKCSSP